MMEQVNGSTRILGILGYPVSHSLSPAMQNVALSASGLNFIYVPFEVAPDGLGAAVTALKALGVAGFNVTIPHKTNVIRFLDELDDSADAAGAVNTVKNISGRLVGYNTDGDGLIRSIASDFQFDVRGARVALIGAGGAARGAVAALCRAGAARIIIANRTQERAQELVSLMSQRFSGTELSAVSDFRELEECLANIDIVVNTTSIGMNCDNAHEVRLTSLPRSAMVYDMVYAPLKTSLLQEADRLGLKSANGLGMLASQGELAFTIWTGVSPPSGLMKSVLDSICGA